MRSLSLMTSPQAEHNTTLRGSTPRQNARFGEPVIAAAVAA
jgi:hypothetical protein